MGHKQFCKCLSKNKLFYDFPYCFSVFSSIDFCFYLYYFLHSNLFYVYFALFYLGSSDRSLDY